MAWPTISYGQVRGGVPQPTGPSFDVAMAQGGGFAGGLAKGLEEIGKWAQREQDARDAVAVSDASMRVTNELDETRRNLDGDADYKGREVKFQAKAKQIYDRELQGLSTPDARRAFHLRYNQLSGSIGLSVRHDARDAEIEDARLALQQNNDAALNKALFARTPEEKKILLDQVRTNIYDAVRTGFVPARMAATMLRQSTIKFQAGEASELIRTSPAAAIAALRDPNQFSHLDATSRQSLMLQAQQRSESLGAQARSELRADISDYRQAREAGQPISPEETARLQTRAKGAGFGPSFDRMKDFYDRVEGYTVGKTLPQLRQAVGDLEKTGTVPDAAVARSVRRQLTAEEREARSQLNDQFKEFEGYRSRGESYPQLTQLLQRAEDYGGPTMAQSVRDRDAFWSRLAAAGNEPASALAGRISMIDRERRAAQSGSLTPEDLEERDALTKALKQKLDLADKDPAAYARRFYPTIDETLRTANEANDAATARLARAALIDAQRQEGIPEHRIALLTKSEADAVEGRLNAPDSRTRIAEVDRLKAAYGPEEWQMVRRQLDAGKKLPPDVEVLATLPATDPRTRELLSQAFTLERSEVEKNIGRDRVKIITDRVDSSGDDVQRIFRATPGGADYFASLKSAAERLAWLYATSHGMDDSMASRTAWNDVFYRHWDISTGVRIPKVDGAPLVDPGTIKDRQREMVAALDRLPLDPGTAPGLEGLSEKRRRAMTVDAVRRRGFWVTAPDDRGAYLFAAPGEPVTVGGRPYYMPFAPGVNTSVFEEIAPARQRMLGGDGYPLPPGSAP